MYADYRCFYCFAESFRKLIEKENLPLEQRNQFTREMAALYSSLGDQLSTTDFSRTLHHLLRTYTSNQDPYKEAKKWSNDLVLSMYPTLRERVLKSDNPFNTALRLSIAGNILDYAIGDTFDLDANIEKVLNTHFAIDDSQTLKMALSKAEPVFFLLMVKCDKIAQELGVRRGDFVVKRNR